MAKLEYRTVNTSTLGGLKEAEKLHTNGWTTERVGFFLVQFSRVSPKKPKNVLDEIGKTFNS